MSAIVVSIDGGSHPNSHKPKLDYLRELSGGDNQFITEILYMFIREAPEAIRQAHEHFQRKNFYLLRMTVHKLKSSVQVVGGYHLASLIQEIESRATEDKPELLQMLLALETGIGHMVNHLCDELNEMTNLRNTA